MMVEEEKEVLKMIYQEDFEEKGEYNIIKINECKYFNFTF